MNLPHIAPLLFAKKVLKKNENSVHVQCSFPQVPTLAMFLEAAAQCSAGFEEEGKKNIGFLTMAQDIQTLAHINSAEYIIILQKEANVANYKKFFFMAYTRTDDTPVVSGNFTLMIQ